MRTLVLIALLTALAAPPATPAAAPSATPSAAPAAGPDRWLRRAWLDLTGAPPPPAEVDAWLARGSAPGPAERARLVERLLATPEFAARWAKVLAAPLAPPDEGRALEPFLAAELTAGRPWWRTLGVLVTPGKAGSPAALFQKPFHDDGALIAGHIGSGMLGIQLRCARCHDDPVQGWSAAEHFGLAAFYGRPRTIQAPARLVSAWRAGKIRTFYDLVIHLPTMKPRGIDHRWVRGAVERAAGQLRQLHGLGLGPAPPRTSGLDWAAADVYRIHAMRARMPARRGGYGGTTGVPIPGTIQELKMPELVPLAGAPHRTALKAGQTVPPRFPGDAAPARVGGKRRDALTDWIADPDNRFTARALVNRVRAQLIGRGLVEPAEEIERPSDATGSAPLAELARELVGAGGSVRWLLARIATSPEYARTADPDNCLTDNSSNAGAELLPPRPTPATTSTVSISVSPTSTSFPEATIRLATFPFRDPEAANACERARDPLPAPAARLAARGRRLLDADQIAASLAAATGHAEIPPAVRDEVAAALELWAASARALPEEAVPSSFPPRMLAAGSALQELCRTAPALAALTALPEDGARLDRLFRAALARPPSDAERAAAPGFLEASGPAGWAALLHRLVTSAEFLTIP